MLTSAAAGVFLLLPLFFIILPQTVGADARSAEIRTQYDYDEDSGLLNYVTDAGGVRTTYAYDHATKAMTMASTSVGGPMYQPFNTF